MYVEVSCPRAASYEKVCEICAEALEMKCEDENTYLFELKLFWIDGTVVPNEPIGDRPWTLGEYLTVQTRNAAQMKLGGWFVDSFIVSGYPNL